MIHLLSSLTKSVNDAGHTFAQADTHLLSDPSERLHKQVNTLSQTIGQLHTHPAKNPLESSETDDRVTEETTDRTEHRHKPSAHSHQALAHWDDNTHDSRRNTISHVDDRVSHLVDKAAESLKTCSTNCTQNDRLQIGKSLSHRLNGLAKFGHHRFDGVGVGPLHVGSRKTSVCKVAFRPLRLFHDALGDSLTHRQSGLLERVSIHENLVFPQDLEFTSKCRLKVFPDLGRVDVVLRCNITHSGFELLGDVDGFSGLSAKTLHRHSRSCDRLQNILHLTLATALQFGRKLYGIGCGVAHQDTGFTERLV